MRFEVLLTADAARDLEEIYGYIAEHDGPAKADYVLGQLERAVAGLTKFPKRGSYPKELLDLGIRDYREVFFRPYRVLYRIESPRVYIYVIADGRRDLQMLLLRRLVGA